MKRRVIRPATLGIGGIVAACSFMFTGTEAFATTNGKTASDAISWAKSNVGRGIDYDGYYGNQCVDLIKEYYAYLGVPVSYGNGADYTGNSIPQGWDRLKGVQPRKGDILVYTRGYNGYGHVAIYESDYSTYHQNYNHSYVEHITYKYNSGSYIVYWGVIRPDFADESSSGQTPQKKTVSKVVKKYNGVWTFFKDGKADYSYTGVAKSTNGNWVFVRNGRFDDTYSGVAKSTTGNWVYVKKGRFNEAYTGVAKSTTGNWVYVKNGRFNEAYTGVAKSTDGNWVYVKKGRFNEKFTGVAKSTTGNWVFVRNGRFDSSFTGVAKSVNGNWVFVRNGRFYTRFTGAAMTINGNCVYVKNGRFVTSFTGVAGVWNSNKKYYMVKGRWNNTFTGKYGNYNIRKGVVV